MYNNDLPTRAELPSGNQLLRSTLIAAVIAAGLLLTTVLPSEYGIDPTGAGRLLGLTQMGEIKTALAQEAAQQTENASVQPRAAGAVSETSAAVVAPAARAPVTAAAPEAVAQPQQTHQLSFTLSPGAAAEIKLVMAKDAKVSYRWSITGGTVNYDTHGDSSTTDYYGYGKGRGVKRDEGVLQAAFDGKHGWFWRNRSGGNVTVTLNTEGDYRSIERML